MKRVGFVTRLDSAKAAKKTKPGRRRLSGDAIQALGSKGAVGLNPAAKTPNMQPVLAAFEGGVYCLAGAPSYKADIVGEPFRGKGSEMVRTMCRNYGRHSSTSFDYVVRTVPKDLKKQVRGDNIEFFRKDVEDAILKADPAVILGFGRAPLQWATKESQIKPAAGKRFPVNIRGKWFWFIPTYDPDFIAGIMPQDEDDRGIRSDKVGWREWVRMWEHHVDVAYQLADSEVPATGYLAEQLLSGVVYIETIKQLKEELAKFDGCISPSYDYETSELRPYTAGALVLSVCYSDGDRTIAVPMQHDEAPWTPLEYRTVVALLREFHAKHGLVAHNIPFELEWDVHIFGPEAIEWAKECSLQAAYVIDPGPPGERTPLGLSLNFLCQQKLGISIKDLTPAALDVKRLRYVALREVLRYNALDARATYILFHKFLMPQVRSEGLEDVYDMQLERVGPVVLAQRTGVPIDQEVNGMLDAEFKQSLVDVRARIAGRKSVKKFHDKTRKDFNPGSPKHVGELLHQILRVPGIKKGHSYTTNKEVLEPLASKHPIVKDVLEYRGIAKLHGTYVEKFRAGAEGGFIYPDGKVHCQFGISKTRTARFNSEGPNNQNWPKRKNKRVRAQMKAPPGYTWVAADYGQIEARVIAVESCDPVWVNMIRNDYDVHAEWSEKIQSVWPGFAEDHEGDQKAMRGATKNKWVFPAFFASSFESIISGLGMPEKLGKPLFDEFWQLFAEVKKWQQAQWKKYQDQLCIKTLTGRVRRGPLSFNMVVNTPIQSLAGDIVIWAANKLSKTARAEEKPWLQYVLQIHDDLTFLVPDEYLDDAVCDIVEAMLSYDAPFMNVPMSVEIETGKDMASMEPVLQVSGGDYDFA